MFTTYIRPQLSCASPLLKEGDTKGENKTGFIDLTDVEDSLSDSSCTRLEGNSVRSQLTKCDLTIFEKNEMLNDNIINTFQKMLANQFEHPAELQVLGAKLKFNTLDVPFVQVLHDGSLHWVAISTYGCKDDEVFYMDSFFSGSITTKIKQQICNLLMCKRDIIKVKVLPVQQQSNMVDCCVYAIAFITTILHGNLKFDAVNFDQVKMRSHMLRGLLKKKNKLLPFPLKFTKTRKCHERVIEIEVFCSCRQIWKKSDDRVFSR
eukprot:gene11537-12729_t